ncbi:E4 protein [human papillomavirus 97]|uniref:E4 protein n=1 Tax=human papillomavirus 97 TaxID=338324 RepID=Q1AHS9_9PAPI|nr:E4 protein [human papillomavirus 97]
MTLCAVPVTKYPLLRLLDHYNTPPRPTPKPRPWAPQKPKRRLLNDLDSVDFRSNTVDVSPTTCTTHYSVQLHLEATNDGSCVVVTLRL